jgi:hypothetical protein
VEQIIPEWFGGWFIRNFIEPSPQGKRAPAPPKIRPTAIVALSVLNRFLSSNQVCRTLIADARNKDVNRVRFWNPLFRGIRFTVGTGLEKLQAMNGGIYCKPSGSGNRPIFRAEFNQCAATDS